MEYVIGIDLGTTNSCVAVAEGKSPVVIANRGGYKTTPSVVAIAESGKRLVGHIAKRQAITNAENTVHGAKRLIGRQWGSAPVNNARITASYQIVEGPHADLRIRLREREFSVPEISSMILQEMKIVAEEHLGSPVSKAVITVPAYFNDNQRQATKDAGAIAGLDVIRIINEPTAAALAYGSSNHTDQVVAIFDLGGGTFDVSVLELNQAGIFKVIATTGDTYLGGEDFDERIMEWLIELFCKQHGRNLRQDRMALQRLRDVAETAKCQLSTLTEFEINLPFIYSTAEGQPLHLQCLLTREHLERLTQDLVDRTVAICAQALQQAELGASEIDEVILVGGMTRMPAIQRAASKFFGRTPSKAVHPDEVVALGAALQGASLIDQSRDLVLLDVTPHALGIVTHGERFEALIPRNTTVPTSQAKVFTTSRDDQTTVRILVMQGSSQLVAENELLGEFHLSGLRKAPRGEVRVEVTFSIDTDGLMSVSAKDVESGQRQSIRVAASSGLTDCELKNMVVSAKEYMVARLHDEQHEATAQRVETLIAELEAKLPELERVTGRDSTWENARRVITGARNALPGAEAQGVQSLLETLERTQRLFRGMLGQSR